MLLTYFFQKGVQNINQSLQSTAHMVAYLVQPQCKFWFDRFLAISSLLVFADELWIQRVVIESIEGFSSKRRR